MAQRSQTPAADNNDGNLTPTMEKIFEECPRFRILAAGRSGGGKSSLINGIFGFQHAKVSDYKPGQADINHEFEGDSNTRFVLHDSMGYEAGEVNNFGKVVGFVESRSKPGIPLAERLHAIWLCIAIPTHGGRIFEAGDENLLKLLSGFKTIPVIVVFTMVDAPVMIRQRRGVEEREANKQAREEVKAMYEQQKCSRPFVCVSTRKGFEGTLVELTNTTMEHMLSLSGKPPPKQPRSSKFFNIRISLPKSSKVHEGENEAQGPSSDQVLLATAQQVDAPMKIQASIAVGKKKYWKNLFTNAVFKGRPLQDCFRTILSDIVLVWNFGGEIENFLLGDEFVAAASHIVDDISRTENLETQNAGANVPQYAQKVGTVVTAAAGFIHPAAAAAVDGALVFSAWIYGVYKQMNGILRCMMASIVGLVLIMEALFEHRTPAEGVSPLSTLVALKVISDYKDSENKRLIHGDIQRFAGTSGIRGRDPVVDEMTKLIGKYKRGGSSYSEWHKLSLSSENNDSKRSSEQNTLLK